MSDLSQKLQKVREIAEGMIRQQLGDDVHPQESILIAKSNYVGHRFKSKNILVEWTIETDVFQMTNTETDDCLGSFPFAELEHREAPRRAA